MRVGWDEYGLREAELIASRSKDPSTKVGCAIFDSNRVIVSKGYNGFPRGIPDDLAMLANREVKLRLIIHAEENALLFARARGIEDGCTLYVWPMPPCARCAAKIMQAGIRRIVAPFGEPGTRERWAQDLSLADWVYEHSGAKLILL